MCGIAGVVGGTHEQFWAMMQANAARSKPGGGWGTTLVSDWSVMHDKFMSDISMVTIPPHLPSAWLQLGHVRAPTHGEQSLLEVHPFEFPSFQLAHNGYLHIDPAVLESVRQPQTDTHVLALTIYSEMQLSESTPVEAIKFAASFFQGQQACWLWDKKTNDVYLWRVMSPIYYSILQDSPPAIGFSSTMLQAALGHFYSWKQLPEGQIWRLHRDVTPSGAAAFEFGPVEMFDFVNPFAEDDGAVRGE